LRDRFTKFNPFKDSRFFIRDKLDQIAQQVLDLDSQGFLALTTLKNFLKNEGRWKEENKAFFYDIDQKLTNFHDLEQVGDKEFGKIENAFELYLKSLRTDCEKWLKVIMNS
jgi:hypothetical protein